MKKYILEKINVKPNDIILVKPQIEKFDLEEIGQIHKNLKESFPNNPVFTIPQGLEIQLKDWESVYDYLLSIKPEK